MDSSMAQAHPNQIKKEAKIMTKQERANYISKQLNRRFPHPPIPLDHKDKYTLLIAVLLSAQCTDKRVNQVTPLLFEKADTPEKMVRLKVDEIREIIKPCGLSPRKSKAIFELSKILIEKHNGKVPDTFEDLEALPGVGHKTASVVIVQGFHRPAFPVDTHIHRLAQIWKLTSGKNVEQTEKDLKCLFPEVQWADLHLQFIYHGREVCPARGCDGLRCDLCKTMFPNRKTPLKARK